MGSRVLLVSSTDSDRTWLQSSLGGGYLLLTVSTDAEANDLFASQHLACAIVCESSAPALRALAILYERPLLLLSDAPRAEADEGVWYVLGRWLPPAMVRTLIESASRGCRAPRFDLDLLAARDRTLLAELFQRLAGQRDLRGAEQACVAIVSELTMVTRAECLFFDSERGLLWSEARAGEPGAERRAVGGLLGYAARTATRVNVSAAAADPRWIETIDGGRRGERLLVQPIVGPSHQVHAVLVAWRAARHSIFAEKDEMRLAGFAERAASQFDQLSLEVEASEGDGEERGRGLFRIEVLESRLPRRHGALLRLPGGSTWPYFALAGLLACAAGLLWIARADLNAVPSEAEGVRIRNVLRSIADYVCDLTERVACDERGNGAGSVGREGEASSARVR